MTKGRVDRDVVTGKGLVCAVRYEGIEREMRGVNARLKRIEAIMIGGAGAGLLMLVHIALK